MIKSTLLIFCICISFSLVGQGIVLNNPSFEDEPSDATTPMGWFECNKTTTPDIFPGYWGVYKEASDGDTYVGMIVREDKSKEIIGQRTSAAMLSDKCYSFSIDLAHSDTYAGYNDPIKVRIFIGQNKCSVDQLIFESEVIEHTDWKTYVVTFTPEKESSYIRIEASDKKGFIGSKGNILLDAISAIAICSKA